MVKLLSQIFRRHFWYSIILFASNFIIAFLIIFNPSSGSSDYSDTVVLIQSSTGTGTGFLINTQGYLLTAAHVVGSDNAVAVISRDGNYFEASVLFSDANSDVALLQASGAGSIPSLLALGNSDAVVETEEVFVIGYPGGNYSITKGIIAEKNPNYLKTDAAANPGNSGGPLVTKTTNTVIGMIIASKVISGNVAEGQHIAIPINSIEMICLNKGYSIR
jgi:S1-C subfamily serine protease